MQTRTIRFPPQLNAMILLETFVIEDWEAGEDRGHKSKTTDGTMIVIYPESFRAKIIGTERKVSKWEKTIIETLDAGHVTSSVRSYLDPTHVASTRTYIEDIVLQVNKVYNAGAYDATSVLIRRVTETLIIECFEAHRIDHKIKDSSQNFFSLSTLISEVIKESDQQGGKWNLGRNTKDGLTKLKIHGDLSAHNRRYLAKRTDLENLQTSFRVVVEELVTIAGLRHR